MSTIEVFGNWGVLRCNKTTGKVIFYDRTNSDSENETDGYTDIVTVDVTRYEEENGELRSAIDIIHIGYWLADGTYEQPTQ